MSLISIRLRDRGYEDVADEIDALEDKVADLTAENAALKADADRYRWLRHGDNDELVLVTYERHTEMTPPCYLPRNEELDAAIDAATGSNT
jgi:hypothetical protein